jgi:hypothetical protein
MSEIQGIPPPDTNPSTALPIPTPPLPSPSATPSPIPNPKHLLAWAPIYLSRSDRVVAHLNKILATPAGTDSFLNAVCYSSLLSSVLLTRLAEHGIRDRAREVVKRATDLQPGVVIWLEGLVGRREGRQLGLAKRLKMLSAMISDFRTFTRLFGLLSLWAWGKRVLGKVRDKDQDGERKGDGVALGIESMQVVVNVCFQVLENGAYLSSKGILGWGKETQKSAWLWSSRFWGAHVALDLVRLAREYAARGKVEIVRVKAGEIWTGSANGESEKEFWRRWKRQIITDCAYAPLTVHWGLEGGLLGETWVGILGSVAGCAGFLEQWRKSGLEIP